MSLLNGHDVMQGDKLTPPTSNQKKKILPTALADDQELFRHLFHFKNQFLWLQSFTQELLKFTKHSSISFKTNSCFLHVRVVSICQRHKPRGSRHGLCRREKALWNVGGGGRQETTSSCYWINVLEITMTCRTENLHRHLSRDVHANPI